MLSLTLRMLVLPIAVLISVSPWAHGYEIHINVGGEEIELPDGTIFLADRPYTPEHGYGFEGGARWHTWHAIGGCPDERLYQDIRHNCLTYHIDPPNDSYVLTFHFCDPISHGIDQGTMGWKINGSWVLSDLDLYARVGRTYAIDYRFPVTVTAGEILLDDIPNPNAELCGLSLISHSPDSDPPSAPVLTEILNGFEEVIINWEDNPEEDVAGYRVYRQLLPQGATICIMQELYLVSRYIDKHAYPDFTYNYWISAVDVYGNEGERSGPFEATPRLHESSPLPVCWIEIDPDSLKALNEDPELDIYYTCTVTLADSTYDAWLRYRGNVVRKLSKKSYKIKLQNTLYEDRRKLNCNSEMCDPCLMRESLSMDLFQDAGVPAPRTWWRALVLNGEHMGTYCDVEQVDEHFLEAREDLDNDANIYKCHANLEVLADSLEYLENYEKETNEDGSWSDLIEFIETLNWVSDEEFYETFIDFFDFEEYLRYFTVLMTINDGDAIYKNFFLYHDLDDDLWKILPWDKDLSWGIRWLFTPGVFWSHGLIQGAYPSGNVLAYRVFNEAILKNLYASMLYELVTESFPLDVIYGRIDATHALVEENGTLDVRKWFWEENDRLQAGDVEIREFAENRYDHILSHLAALVSGQELYINEFMAANDTTIADEFGEFDDWIEIYNPGPDPVFMGDYFLTDDLYDPIQWAFPDTTLQPECFLLVWADDDGQQGPLHANFKLSRNGEMIALHKKEDGAGPEIDPDDIDPMDLIFFGPQVADISRARIYDADYRWALRELPSPGQSNGSLQGVDGESGDLLLTLEGALRLQARPNPFRATVSLVLAGDRRSGAVEIFDLHGRLCRRLENDRSSGRWAWDGLLLNGCPAPRGYYWARFRAQDSVAGPAHRILFIR